MECDQSIIEMKIEPAKAILTFVVANIYPKINDEKATLKPISRAFYTHMGTIGFISEAYSFPYPSNHPYDLKISDSPFQVVLVPNQTVSLYKAVHDTSSNGILDALGSEAWTTSKLELNKDMVDLGFKNEYIYCRNIEKSLFACRDIPFAYTPDLEIKLWGTMRTVDSFYLEKIRERVPTYGQQAEKGPEIIDANAPETGIVPFKETGGLVHLIGFRADVPAKRE